MIFIYKKNSNKIIDGMSSNELLQCLVPTRELSITNFLGVTTAEETQEEEDS